MQFIAKACQKNYHLTSILFTFYLSHNNLEELKEEAINFTFEVKYLFLQTYKYLKAFVVRRE